MLALSGLVARPVVDVVLAVLDERGALTALSVSRHKLGLYMARINDGYVVSNPYHTATHAANVVWDCQHMLRRCSVEVDALHYFALMVAAAVHDFLHPGYTNKFCIEATHPVAITYNDSSPLENFHVAEAFKCAMEMGEQNPLNDLTPGQYQTARELIIKLVMATVGCCAVYSTTPHHALPAAYHRPRLRRHVRWTPTRTWPPTSGSSPRCRPRVTSATLAVPTPWLSGRAPRWPSRAS